MFTVVKKFKHRSANGVCLIAKLQQFHQNFKFTVWLLLALNQLFSSLLEAAKQTHFETS